MKPDRKKSQSPYQRYNKSPYAYPPWAQSNRKGGWLAPIPSNVQRELFDARARTGATK